MGKAITHFPTYFSLFIINFSSFCLVHFSRSCLLQTKNFRLIDRQLCTLHYSTLRRSTQHSDFLCSRTLHDLSKTCRQRCLKDLQAVDSMAWQEAWQENESRDCSMWFASEVCIWCHITTPDHKISVTACHRLVPPAGLACRRNSVIWTSKRAGPERPDQNGDRYPNSTTRPGNGKVKFSTSDSFVQRVLCTPELAVPRVANSIDGGDDYSSNNNERKRSKSKSIKWKRRNRWSNCFVCFNFAKDTSKKRRRTCKESNKQL